MFVTFGCNSIGTFIGSVGVSCVVKSAKIDCYVSSEIFNLVKVALKPSKSTSPSLISDAIAKSTAAFFSGVNAANVGFAVRLVKSTL